MDPVLLWILGSGLAMAALALVGGLAYALPEPVLKRAVLPLVAVAAGTLIGGAFFHLIPSGVEALGDADTVYAVVVGGFATFFVLDQFLYWHHDHHGLPHGRKPFGYLVLMADGLHNLIGGLATGAAFVTDIRLGLTVWAANAAHEIPQELGDFGVLVHSGWRRRRALLYNFLSGLTFPLGGLVAYALSDRVDIAWALPFAAGNFLYIAAADLMPEIRSHRTVKIGLVTFLAFLTGVVLLWAVRLLEH